VPLQVGGKRNTIASNSTFKIYDITRLIKSRYRGGNHKWDGNAYTAAGCEKICREDSECDHFMVCLATECARL
jgi:hypothetical protein